MNLVRGDQRSAGYKRLNPMGLVPTLQLSDGTRLTQSLAILDWLEAVEPDPPLWPKDPLERARVTAAGHTIAVDTHPIQNVGVINHLKQEYGFDQDKSVAWMRHWMHRGLAAYQELCDQDTTYSFGDQPTFADICLIPQLYNARRWKLNTKPYDRLLQIERRCLRLPAFNEARPEKQPDADP